MLDFVTNLGFLASQNYFLAYLGFYVATIFLGNIAEFTGFWLVFRGFLGPWGLFFFPCVVLAASFSGDLLWYSIGRGLRNTRFGNFVRNRLPGHAKIEERIRKNGRNWIFMARFVYGSAFPILFSTGWAGMRFKKILHMSLVSNAAWVPILSGIAYGLTASLTPLQSVDAFKHFEVVFIIGIVSFLILNYLVTKLVKHLFKSLTDQSP